jgi:hypothetical protein
MGFLTSLIQWYGDGNLDFNKKQTAISIFLIPSLLFGHSPNTELAPLEFLDGFIFGLVQFD